MTKAREKAIEEHAQKIKNELDKEILKLIVLANSDLYIGPIYLDEDGEIVSMWDEGAKAFDFSDAVQQISAALSDIETVYVDDDGNIYESNPEEDEMYWEWYDEESGEFTNEDPDDGTGPLYTGPDPYYDVESNDIIRAIVGDELARHV